MSRSLARLVTLAAALALAAPAAAQEKAATQAQVGVGVSLAPFDFLAVASSGGISPVQVYVPINFDTLRIEPSLGIYTLDVDGGDSASVVSLGVGVFYVKKPAANLSTYIGPRLALGFKSQKDGGTGQKVSGTDLRLAAAVGGEWWASPQFAVGVEAQAAFVNIGKLSGDGVTVQDSATSLQTTGLIFARYYF